MNPARLPHLTTRLQGFGTSIFTEMTALAVAHGAVNLGQGFPDFDGPEFVKDAAIQAIRDGKNQYCRMAGTLEMARAVADHQQRFYGLTYDPESEVTVYSGATEALCSTFQALLEAGDEVVVFEPAYDAYAPGVSMAGAVVRPVALRPPSFGLDAAALASAIGPRTRALVLNTPNNPTGKLFTAGELEQIAALCRDNDLYAVTDEVYEHIVFEGRHVPLAGLAGMRERTVQVSSTGKTFSLTGWKIGYTCASSAITAALRSSHQFVTFCTATPFQHAMAAALAAGDEYYRGLQADYRARRDRLCEGLAEAGFGVLPPAGTYFVLADIRPLGFEDDVAFCRALPERAGVVAIPTSVFGLSGTQARHLVRFAFCKSDATLDEGLRRLRRLRR